MIVKCIDSGSYHLTVGKNYYVKKYDWDFYALWTPDYLIINDRGIEHAVEKELFIINFQEMRNEKLKKLGI
jgi:hypothetical protein